MLREVVFDTETTGLDPYQGHRLIEIGCIELVNRIPTGQVFHRYVNPQRDIPAEAFAVHGLSAEFLSDKPLFGEVAGELVDFLGDAPLIAHNAAFDLGFLNAELERVERPSIPRARLVDTLLLARRKYPGAQNRLDDLCLRFRIDHSRRQRHGALLDAELLAEVYLELIEARQAQLGLEVVGSRQAVALANSAPRIRTVALLPRLSAEDRAAHRAFIESLGPQAIWLDYLPLAAGKTDAEKTSRAQAG
jgi:DNA polymerase-3 subunit epsilon